MSFVIYDVETTGLSTRFDQILQFAAILTDSDLAVLDQEVFRARLSRHVIPSPEALRITGLHIGQLIHPSLPSHYAMVTDIRSTLVSWGPAIHLGYNSIPFDEEFLRHALYQCLYEPFLTNTQGSARADVLPLCRLAACLRPHVFRPARHPDGSVSFRLRALAAANDCPIGTPHDPMADAMATLSLCRTIRRRAPDVWSQFVRFSQRASVEAFIVEEDAFLVSETFGNQHRFRVVAPIGPHPAQPRHYCLDLSADVDSLASMSDAELVTVCEGLDSPVVAVRTNRAPTLWPLYEAPAELIEPFADEAEVLQRVGQLRAHADLYGRLRQAAQDAEPVYPPSDHVEDQLYGHGFPSDQDRTLMDSFHSLPWVSRQDTARRLADPRLRRLALRLIYLERPDVLPAKWRSRADEALRKRLAALPDARVPWRSIPAAQRELVGLLAEDPDGELVAQTRYLAYLDDRASELGLPPVGDPDHLKAMPARSGRRERPSALTA
ncbi:MAG: exonuclease domain-containing protein [Gammaproteobacteria bacterium]|nr:exonuclease domain-containing protein [Gammaproteobacteria bacterium]